MNRRSREDCAAKEPDEVFSNFLVAQHQAGRELASSSDLLHLHAVDGELTRRFIARFKARTLVRLHNGSIAAAEGFWLGIYLNEDYLRYVPPFCTLTYLGPHHGPEKFIWHPQTDGVRVCLDVYPGMPLKDLLYAAYELLTWQRYGTADDGLNPDAAQWARTQQTFSLPVDKRPLKWKAPQDLLEASP